jgi:hypothetical protein
MTAERMIAGGALVLPTFAAATIALILKKLSAELSEFLRERPDAQDAGRGALAPSTRAGHSASGA